MHLNDLGHYHQITCGVEQAWHWPQHAGVHIIRSGYWWDHPHDIGGIIVVILVGLFITIILREHKPTMVGMCL